MPTFQFYKNSSKIDEFSGADPNKLKAYIEKHKSASSSSSSSSSGGGGETSAFSGGGHVLGSGSGTSGGHPLANKFGGGSTTNTQPTTVPPLALHPPAPKPAQDTEVNEVFLDNMI